jgi:hypothetical protein
MSVVSGPLEVALVEIDDTLWRIGRGHGHRLEDLVIKRNSFR